MDISNIGYSSSYRSAVLRQEKTQGKKSEDAQVKQQGEEQASLPRQDTFVRTGTSKPVTYSNKLSDAQVQQLQNEQVQRMESFTRMLRSMVVKQGQQSNLTLFGLELYVSPEESSKAAASIAEGGEYSVDAVAGRIMDMAKALSGGDASKIAELREAVQKGFQAAGVDFGGKLPSICGQTYDEVMKRFDEWEQESREAFAGIQE